MKKLSVPAILLMLLFALPLFAEQQTWENVSIMDGMCLSKTKADPDKHTKKCLLQCSGGGLGLIDSEGNYLKFDDEGNEKVLAVLKESEKTDHLRMTIEGERTGDTVKVISAKMN